MQVSKDYASSKLIWYFTISSLISIIYEIATNATSFKNIFVQANKLKSDCYYLDLESNVIKRIHTSLANFGYAV